MKHLKCQLLDHKNPYLRLGPFKFEILHEDPEISILHDLVSLNETSEIRNEALYSKIWKNSAITIGHILWKKIQNTLRQTVCKY